MKRTCVVMVSLLMMLSACKKSKTVPKEDDPFIPPVTTGPGTSQSVSAANNRGDYDSAARMCNEGMDYVYKSMLKSGDTTLVKASAYGSAYAKIKLQRDLSDVQLRMAVLPVVQDAPSRFRTVTGRLPVSDQVKAGLLHITDLVQDTAGLGTSPYYQTLKSRLVSYELDVEKSQLSADEKKMLLQACAVARYSMLYGITCDIEATATVQRFSIKKVLQVLTIAASDVIAFASTFAGGDVRDAIAAAMTAGAYAACSENYYVPLP